MKALKTPQRSMKIKIKLIFVLIHQLCEMHGARRVKKVLEYSCPVS